MADTHSCRKNSSFEHEFLSMIDEKALLFTQLTKMTKELTMSQI